MRTESKAVIAGIPVLAVTRSEYAERMARDVKEARQDRAGRPKLLTALNAQHISAYWRDPDFRHVHDQFDEVVADGESVVRASRAFCAVGLPERVATTDFIHDAARVAARDGISFYVLGADEAVNAKACERLEREYPGLRIVGRHHGYLGPDDEARVVAEIAEKGPDVLWVGMGAPKQHFFMARHRDSLRGVAWIKGCGGCLEFLAGDRARAPQWMQSFGLEWLYRLCQEPTRLWRRYTLDNARAAWFALTRSR